MGVVASAFNYFWRFMKGETMDETVLKIALAGLMHDIGKLVVKDDFLDVGREYIENNQMQYCRFNGKVHTHRHAVLTAAFIEKFAEILPSQLNHGGWGEGDSFINLAAGHHKPETPMQWIVAGADRLASGLDREEYDDYSLQTPPRDYRKTRIQPLLEQLGKGELCEREKTSGVYAASWRYPLLPLSPSSIFPKLVSELEPADNDAAAVEYNELFDGFIAELRNLAHLDRIPLWMEHFDSLLMEYTSCIPQARDGNVVPDVSLYDHSRTTAALSAALYVYHRDAGTLTEAAIRDSGAAKFLLVSGDFYGIQDFIFKAKGDTRKYRSKLLRGRSFMVSLFSELAADMICREIGLPVTSIALNAAGRFTIIAPNTETAIQAVRRVDGTINKWLVRVSFGQSAMGISMLEASPKDFTHDHFASLWDRLQEGTSARKYTRIDLDRFGGAFQGYLNSFNNDLDHPLCPLCGIRPAEADQKLGGGDDGVNVCGICKDQKEIGENLVKKPILGIYDADNGAAKGLLARPIYERYQISFLADADGMSRNSRLLRAWRLELEAASTGNAGLTKKFLKGYVPVYAREDEFDDRYLVGRGGDKKKEELIDAIRDGGPKSFVHIALLALDEGKAVGLPSLGVFKADVDDLGRLMALGLPEKGLSFSRMATLSRQMNFFFTLHLPDLLGREKDFSNVYTVFAGGDDLFLIGPWNAVIDLADRLSTDFKEYVCRNEAVHFSAGITLHKPHTPVDQMAEAAEHALEKAKAGPGIGREAANPKNRITLFGETVSFANFASLLEVRDKIQGWLETETVGVAMFYRLNELIEKAGREKRLKDKMKGGGIGPGDWECLRWRALLAYGAARNVGRNVKGSQREELIQEVRKTLHDWIETYGGALRAPLWNVLYNHRRV